MILVEYVRTVWIHDRKLGKTLKLEPRDNPMIELKFEVSPKEAEELKIAHNSEDGIRLLIDTEGRRKR